MRFPLPRTYKLLLSLALVIGPFYWLMFTEDGKRRSDLLVLSLTGAKAFNIAYDKLSPAVTEAMIRELFPKIDFQCRELESSRLGDRQCAAEIASFNGLPARAARLYFAGDSLRMLELSYRLPYHEMLSQALYAGLGEPREESTGRQPVHVWQASGGEIMLPATAPRRSADAALIWLAVPVRAPLPGPESS